MAYNMAFPKIKDSMIQSSIKQVDKIYEEAGEVSECLENGFDPTSTAVEVLDVIHACETLLDVLEFEGADLGAAYIEVVSKNAKRGYYGSNVQDHTDF